MSNDKPLTNLLADREINAITERRFAGLAHEFQIAGARAAAIEEVSIDARVEEVTRKMAAEFDRILGVGTVDPDQIRRDARALVERFILGAGQMLPPDADIQIDEHGNIAATFSIPSPPLHEFTFTHNIAGDVYGIAPGEVEIYCEHAYEWMTRREHARLHAKWRREEREGR